MLENNKTYQIQENSLLFDVVFIGKFYALKGDLNQNKIKKDSLEYSNYPVFVFYSEDFGIKVFNSLKQFSYEEKKLNLKNNISDINEEIKNIRKQNKNHKIFNTILWKSILRFDKEKLPL